MLTYTYSGRKWDYQSRHCRTLQQNYVGKDSSSPGTWGGNSYIHSLEDMDLAYNDSSHAAIALAPMEVDDEYREDVWMKLYQ